MSGARSPLEILRLLDKSNCGDCGKPTCLAFAAAVSSGQKELAACRKLQSGIVDKYAGSVARPSPQEEDPGAAIESLKQKIAAINLADAARRLEAAFVNGKLTIRCLGQILSVDANGNISTEMHVHGWLMVPVLNYIIDGMGIPPSGNWVSFRDLEGGAAKYPLFAQMCEKRCKRLADGDAQLFADILSLFGRPAANRYSSHISFVLHPLPRVPVLIRYWMPEDELESNLHFLFDSTTPRNIDIEAAYLLGTGLVMMFEKIALKHGWF
jgi:hypothetical protein